MTGIRITVEPDEGCDGHHGHHDPQEVVPFEKEKDDLPPKTAGDDNRTKELIAQEERASNDYDQLADEADDPATKKVFEDISDEEKVHAGELLILLLRQDPKEKEALGEGSEEVKELVGGESFREMFAKGRKKVEDKANGAENQDILGHFEGKKSIERDLKRADRRISQGTSPRENPRMGEKRAQSTEEEARKKQGLPEPGSTKKVTRMVDSEEGTKWVTEKVPIKTVHTDPSKRPSERKRPKGKPDTASRPGPEHDIGGTNDRVVSMEEKYTPNEIIHKQIFAKLPSGEIISPNLDPMLTAMTNKPELDDYFKEVLDRYEDSYAKPRHTPKPVPREAYGAPVSTYGNDAPQVRTRLPDEAVPTQHKTVLNALKELGISFDDEAEDPNADSEGRTDD